MYEVASENLHAVQGCIRFILRFNNLGLTDGVFDGCVRVGGYHYNLSLKFIFLVKTPAWGMGTGTGMTQRYPYPYPGPARVTHTRVDP
jgi:hypothetical protein